MHAYQPMSGLQSPALVDPTVRNFEGLRMVAHCPPSDGLTPTQTRTLCRRAAALFENQGATVETVQTEGIPDDLFTNIGGPPVPTEPEESAPPPTEGPPPPERLVLELRSREVPREPSGLSWALSALTFTLVPAVEEFPLRIDVRVRDTDGFVLLQERLTGRIVMRFGLGTWLVNGVLDRISRSNEERLTMESAEEALSRDLYARLSQAVFDGRMRARVLDAAAEGPR